MNQHEPRWTERENWRVSRTPRCVLVLHTLLFSLLSLHFSLNGNEIYEVWWYNVITPLEPWHCKKLLKCEGRGIHVSSVILD